MPRSVEAKNYLQSVVSTDEDKLEGALLLDIYAMVLNNTGY